MVETGRSSIFGEEIHHSKVYRMLGLLNGVLIGLALVIGAWGLSAYTEASLPTRTPIAGFIGGSLVVMTLSGVAGWLTARSAKGAFTFLIWLLAAGLSVVTIGLEPTLIRTLSVWLADYRFWGLSIYPLSAGATLVTIIGGFFVYLAFGALAFLQDYRLEGIHGALGPNNAITFSAVLLLCLPLPFVAIAGAITNNIVSTANAPFAIEMVHEVIQTGRTYEGDLFELSRTSGVNYNAIRGVREMMSENYTLGISGYDPANVTVIVTAEFDNGAWIDCRVVNEQVSFCFDASPPYTTGFSSLITGEPLPDVCSGCDISVDDAWREWLMARSDALDSDPQIEKVVQRGIYTLMRAESPDGDFAIECWFHRSGVITLENCSEVTE